MSRLLFLLLSLTYLILYVLKANSIHLGWVSAYVGDLLCLPITLTVIRFLMIKLKVIDQSFEFSFAMVLFAIISYSFVFEYYMPLVSLNYYSDIWDIVAYLLGGVAYYIFRQTLSLTLISK